MYNSYYSQQTNTPNWSFYWLDLWAPR